VLVAIAAVAIALGVGVHTRGNLTQAWRMLRLDATSPELADTHTVTNSIDCLLQGQDPYFVRSFDPLHRVYNYPPIWLDLRYLGVTSRSTTMVEAVMLTMFLAALLLVFETRRWFAGILIFFALVSRPILSAVERGNTDLVIFSLMVFGFFLAERRSARVRSLLQGGLIVLLTVLKIYPVVAVAVFVRNRRGLLLALGVAILSVAALVLTSGHRLPLILANTPQILNYSYGAVPASIGPIRHVSRPFGDYIYYHQVVATLGALVIAFVSAAAGTIGFRRLRRVLPELDLDRALGCIAVSGLTIYCFTFARGSNFEYRLIFLLAPMAYLVSDLNRSRSLRSLPAAMVLVLFLCIGWSGHDLPGQFLDILVFTTSCAWLGATLLLHLRPPSPALPPPATAMLPSTPLSQK
jgi:hypothetical protein